jgi:hypothetical protein
LNNVLFSRVSHPTGTVVFFGGDGEFNLWLKKQIPLPITFCFMAS